MWGIVGPKQFFFLSRKTKLLVDFEPKIKRDPIVILNNILWVHILLSEENNVVYSFDQIEKEMNEKIGSQMTLLKR